MKITLERVERLRKRVECDYQTAERVLRKTGGDEDQAVLHILKRREHRGRRLVEQLGEWLRQGWSIRFVVLKNRKVIVKFPVLLLGLGLLLFEIPMGFLMAVLLLAIVLGYEFDMVQGERIESEEESLAGGQKKKQGSNVEEVDPKTPDPKTPDPKSAQDEEEYHEIIIE